VIRPWVQADWGEFGDEGCAAQHCKEPYRIGDTIKCACISCDSQVGCVSLFHTSFCQCSHISLLVVPFNLHSITSC
jgi:hypothetical protein